MTPVTQQDSRTQPPLSFRLHEQARRERARAISLLIGKAFARLVERLTPKHQPSDLAARWG